MISTGIEKTNSSRIAGLLLFACCSWVLVCTAFAQSGGQFNIAQSVISGGGDRSSGGNFVLVGTTGEPVAGTLSNGSQFNLRGGFWSGLLASPNVSVSGRVTTSAGRGVRNAKVNLINAVSGTVQVLTGPLGSYRFGNVVPGQTYTVTVNSRRFTFTSQLVDVSDALTNIDFVSSP